MTQPSNIIQFPDRKEIKRSSEGEKDLITYADVNDVLDDYERVWICRCDHPLFFISKGRGIVCQACGQIQVWGPDQ